MDIDMVYRAMLRQELTRPDFARKYEYLKYRRILVDWMCEVGEEMQVRKETVHTAIAYLERVLTVRSRSLWSVSSVEAYGEIDGGAHVTD